MAYQSIVKTALPRFAPLSLAATSATPAVLGHRFIRMPEEPLLGRWSYGTFTVAIERSTGSQVAVKGFHRHLDLRTKRKVAAVVYALKTSKHVSNLEDH